MTWIDCTDSTKISITGSTFTVLNKTGNTSYDFIQTDPSNHPVITDEGISFSGDNHLRPRQLDIFSPVLQNPSYSMVFITKGNPRIEQQLLSISKNNPDLPKFLDIRQYEGHSKKSFSNVNLQSFLSFPAFISSIQSLSFSHDIRLGRTVASVNNSSFKPYIDTNKGYILSNFPSAFYLGNSNTLLPYLGSILHFLIFIPSIAPEHLHNIVNLLNNRKATLPLKSAEPVAFNNAAINMASIVELGASTKYQHPSDSIVSFNHCLLDLVSEISLSFYYKWDELLESNWFNMGEEFWDNLD